MHGAKHGTGLYDMPSDEDSIDDGVPPLIYSEDDELPHKRFEQDTRSQSYPPKGPSHGIKLF
eukprot:6989570-Karenia_brevis.AAC.1